MMIKEFTERTGFEPMPDEYEEIEEAYYLFDGTKDEFCDDWVRDGGIGKICEARGEKIRILRSELLELDRQLRMSADRYEARIAELEEKLEPAGETERR